MYFVTNKNNFCGYGKTLLEAIADLNDQDEHDDIMSLTFYKAQKINVVLQELPTPVEVPKKITRK